MELYFSFFFKLLVVNINNFLHENNFFALGRSISYRRVFATYLIPSLENIYIYPINCWGVHVYARATSNYTHVCFTCAHTLSPDKEPGATRERVGQGANGSNREEESARRG